MSVIGVVHLDLASNALVPAGVDRRLESVGVIEVLHCFRAKIDTELFKLARLGVFKAKHVPLLQSVRKIFFVEDLCDRSFSFILS